MTRLTRFFTQFSVFFTIAFLLWVSAEAVARFIVREIKWDAPPYMLAFTDDHIRKLYNTDNPAFYREVVLEGWGRSINLEYEPFVEFMPVAISGKHVNVAPEGFRIAPSGARKLNLPGNKVFVFGGSTAFGMGVSDGETIAAYLEQEFRASGRKDVAVFNFGVVAMFVQQPIPSYAYDNDRRPVPVRDIKSTPWQQTRRGYEIFRERRDKGNTFRENVLWLEEASIPENMYIDEVHYSPHFNRYIARQIYEALRERLKP
jgi:hypothetical protein